MSDKVLTQEAVNGIVARRLGWSIKLTKDRYYGGICLGLFNPDGLEVSLWAGEESMEYLGTLDEDIANKTYWQQVPNYSGDLLEAWSILWKMLDAGHPYTLELHRDTAQTAYAICVEFINWTIPKK